jgi:hypothetical protein
MSENAAILRALQSHLGQKLILDFLDEQNELDKLDWLCCPETLPPFEQIDAHARSRLLSRSMPKHREESCSPSTDEETPCEDEATDEDQCFPVSGSAEETTWDTEQVNLRAFAFSDHWVSPEEEA